MENIKQVFKKSSINVSSLNSTPRNKRHWTTYDATNAVSELNMKRANTEKELPRILPLSSHEPTPRTMAKPCHSFHGNVQELQSLSQELKDNADCRTRSILLIQKMKKVLQKAESSLRHESMQHARSYSVQPSTSSSTLNPVQSLSNSEPMQEDSDHIIESMILDSSWNDLKHSREKTADTIVDNTILF